MKKIRLGESLTCALIALNGAISISMVSLFTGKVDPLPGIIFGWIITFATIFLLAMFAQWKWNKMWRDFFDSFNDFNDDEL